ncbi:MAG TPA: RDD family protein [Acidimicrobiia bacterium]|nr:RDD family protein [Acidimicrobiia bacterium]
MGSILDPMINAVDLDELLAGVDLDRVLARIDPNTILERVDLGRVIARLDLDDVLRRVDVDAIVRRVDVEAIVERVDIASIVARVDVDQIVDRVDVPRIVERVNVARVATSTATTMTSSALDLVRRQVARLDVLLASFVRRVFRRRAPTALVPGETVLYPAGAFTRLLAYVVDTLAISALLAGAVSLFTYLADLFLTNDLHPTRGAGEWWGVVAAAVTFGYFWLSVAATGRTPGKALLGLRVVRRNGDAVGGRAAFVRALVFPFSFVLGLGFVGVVGGRSRRALHDVVAGTVVVYDRETAAPMSSAKLPE